MSTYPMFSIGDKVKTNKGSAIVGSGKITSIVKGGENIGMPWEDDTPHYVFTDEKTGMLMICHPKSLELVS